MFRLILIKQLDTQFTIYVQDAGQDGGHDDVHSTKQFTRLACAGDKSPDRARCNHEQVERGGLRGPQCAIKHN